MWFFKRHSAFASNTRPKQTAAIEGLEGRRLLSASIAHANVAAGANAGVHSHLSHMHVSGTVVGTDTGAGTITISSGGQGGSTTQATYSVDAAATISANGRAVTLGDLVQGVKVVLTVGSTTPTTVTAIKAQAARVSGVVTAVDTTLGTISLTTRRGATPTTYTIPATASVTVNHVAGSLADITVGSTVHLQFSPLSGTTVTAVAAHTKGASASSLPTSLPTSSATTNSSSTNNSSSGSTSGTSSGSTASGTASSTNTDSSNSGGTTTDPNPSTGAGSGFEWGGIGQQIAFGTLVSVDTTANTITLSNIWTQSGTPSTTTYTLASGATITADGTTATLGALAAGDQVLLNLSGTTPVTVTKIAAIGKSLDGSVTAVDTTADTITLMPDDGSASTTVTIPSAATITVDGATGTLAGITTGSQVHIQYSALDNTTITSVNDFALPTGLPGGFGGFSGDHLNDSAFGTLVSVDTTAGTITLSTETFGSSTPTQTTYTLGTGATITAGGATATLGALSVGDQIQLTLTTATPVTVTAVVATGSKVSGSVTAVDTTANTITLTPNDGSASTTVTIPSTATITIDGATGTLAGITTGSQVRIQYSALDNTMVVSVTDSTHSHGGGDHNQNNGAFGSLVSVDTTANTITLSSNSFGSSTPTQTTYTLGTGATITADGATATLAALSVGDQIRLTLTTTTPATVTAVVATGSNVSGSVTAVDTTANTITLTPNDGSASTTVTIPSTATITIDGTVGTLAGITTGSEVRIQYSAIDNTMVVSVSDSTHSHGGGDHNQNDGAFGTLVSVDATANTITLSSNGFGSSTPTQTTYALGAGATITADGATATLGGLAVGDQVFLSLSSTTPTTVTAIKATGKSLDGQVTAIDTTADTITLTPNDGSAATTITIPTGAAITINGSTGALTGITIGAEVHIQYSALDNTTITSVNAFALPAGWGGFGGGSNSNGGEGFGGFSGTNNSGGLAGLFSGGGGFGL